MEGLRKADFRSCAKCAFHSTIDFFCLVNFRAEATARDLCLLISVRWQKFAVGLSRGQSMLLRSQLSFCLGRKFG